MLPLNPNLSAAERPHVECLHSAEEQHNAHVPHCASLAVLHAATCMPMHLHSACTEIGRINHSSACKRAQRELLAALGLTDLSALALPRERTRFCWHQRDHQASSSNHTEYLFSGPTASYQSTTAPRAVVGGSQRGKRSSSCSSCAGTLYAIGV